MLVLEMDFPLAEEGPACSAGWASGARKGNVSQQKQMHALGRG